MNRENRIRFFKTQATTTIPLTPNKQTAPQRCEHGCLILGGQAVSAPSAAASLQRFNRFFQGPSMLREAKAFVVRTGSAVMQPEGPTECNYLEALGASDFTTEQEDRDILPCP